MIHKYKKFIRIFLLSLILILYATSLYFIVMDYNGTIFYVLIGLWSFNYVCSFTIALYLINSKRYPSFKTLWIFVLLILPIFGILLYAFVGMNLLKRRDFYEQGYDRANFFYLEDFTYTNQLICQENLNDPILQLFRYNARSSLRPICRKNIIKKIPNNQTYLDWMLKAIYEAKHFIHLEFYIFARGRVWNMLVKALVQKMKEGVKVRILYDILGSYFQIGEKQLRYLIKQGAIVQGFNEFFSNPIGLSNFRCHKKAVIIDNKIVFYGSSNMMDGSFYRDSKVKQSFEEMNFYLEGPIANSFNLLFYMDWKHYSRVKKSDLKEILENKDMYFKIHEIQNSQEELIDCQLIESHPDYQEKIIANNLVQLITKAKKNITIATPYFLPPNEILNAIKMAALSGVKVRILLPTLPDYRNLVLTMNRKSSEALFNTGAVIYEYKDFNHYKFLIIDDEIVCTGTYNFDYRSLFMNFENAIVFRSKKVANEMLKVFDEHVKHSSILDAISFAKINTWKFKFSALFINLIHPLI